MSQSTQTPDRHTVSIIFAEGTGSVTLLLGIAEQQGFFQKHGVEAQLIAARGAVIPRLSSETPLGMIGEPAALLQAAGGSDVRIVASFSNINLSGHLVARPGIKDADGLRGKRVGVRVVGAGLWISTILALEQLGLEPQRDSIQTLPIGSPIEIFRALQRGTIDAALVSSNQSRDLRAKGYSVLLQDYPSDISSYGGGLVATNSFLIEHPDVVEHVVTASVEALAFSLANSNRAEVMQGFNTFLNITDSNIAESNLSELKRKPYASLAALKKMQRVIAIHDSRVRNLNIEDLIDDRFVRKLDANGTLDRLFNGAVGSR